MKSKPKIPKVIGLKTKGLEPLIQKWAAGNQGVPFSELIRRGLRRELQPIAGKRYAHLLAASFILFFALTAKQMADATTGFFLG